MGSNMHTPVEDARETGRIEAFSDGVFAVAITLLVLDLKVPHDMLEGRDLLAALLRQWPAYAGFVTSFGIMWVNHHRLFSLIRRSDDVPLMLNLLLLLGITVIPFSTAVLAEYFPRTGRYVAAEMFSGTYVMVAIFFYLLWWYASHRGRLLGKGADPHMVAAITRGYAFGPPPTCSRSSWRS